MQYNAIRKITFKYVHGIHATQQCNTYTLETCRTSMYIQFLCAHIHLVDLVGYHDIIDHSYCLVKTLSTADPACNIVHDLHM
jgi:hypothetical protein